MHVRVLSQNLHMLARQAWLGPVIKFNIPVRSPNMIVPMMRSAWAVVLAVAGSRGGEGGRVVLSVCDVPRNHLREQSHASTEINITKEINI